MIGTNFDALDIGLPLHQLREAMAAVQNGCEEQDDQVLEGLDRRGRRILCSVTYPRCSTSIRVIMASCWCFRTSPRSAPRGI